MAWHTSQQPWPIARVCLPGSFVGFSAMSAFMADAISGVTLYGEPPLCCTRRSTCSQLYAEESHQGGVEAYADAMPMKRGGTDTTCLFPWDVCEIRAVDENVSGAEFAAVRNASCEILVAFAVLACVCRSTGALLCAAGVACRIARGIDATGAIEWCRTCPSKLMLIEQW